MDKAQRSKAILATARHPEPELASAHGRLDGWNQLGNLLRRVGELAQAELAYQRVLRLAGHDQGNQAVARLAGVGVASLEDGFASAKFEFYFIASFYIKYNQQLPLCAALFRR